MLKKLSINIGLSVLDRLYFASIIFGIAIAYSVVYLFHLLTFIKVIVNVIYRQKDIGNWNLLRSDSVILLIMISIYSLSTLWSEDSLRSLTYIAYPILGYSIIYNSVNDLYNEKKIKDATYIVSVLVTLEIVLSFFESLGIIRLPFSAYSQYAQYFGRKASDFSELSSAQIDGLKYVATGFHGNPNNLAAAIVIAIPFIIFSRKFVLKTILLIFSVFVVYFSGARIAALTLLFSFILAFVFYSSAKLKFFVFTCFFVAFLFNGQLMRLVNGADSQRLSDLVSIPQAIEEFLDSSTSQGSSSVRRELIDNGVSALWEANGLGVGPGGSVMIQEKIGGVNGKITSMHNFWVEILVDGGILFFLIFTTWYLSLAIRVRRVGKNSSDPMLRYLGRSLFIALLAFIPGALGPSSTIYFLPMWLMFGFSLAIIAMNRRLECEKMIQKHSVNLKDLA